MKKLISTLILMTVGFASVNAQNNAESLYTDYRTDLIGTFKDNINDVIVTTAKHFLDAPYVGHTLDSNSVEQLVVNLDRFDCMTFVETVLALSIDYMSENPSYDNFVSTLQKIRYRGGIINGYPSRLHYTSDWIYDNSQKGIVADRTKSLGGVPFRPILNYMSTHPQNYNQLKNNRQAVDSMRLIEKQINLRKAMYYIPKVRVSSVAKNINSGDIIMITTSAVGLDYGHVGFAIKEGNVLKFIHASSDQKKVVITSGPLHTYLLNVKSFTGISVLKANANVKTTIP
ncbi:MAG: DUF1460 domain-containing protein [Bacteroidales bacterium]|nr:DUF1460 domain-containing protein [Bacteroidales bacterium]